MLNKQHNKVRQGEVRPRNVKESVLVDNIYTPSESETSDVEVCTVG